MPRLFDPTDSYVSEADVTGEPSQFDQRGAEAQPQLPTPTEYETTREVRIEPFQPQQIAQEVRKPRSIMERMREVASSLVEPNPQTGMSGLEIFGSTLQDVGAAIDRRPGGNLERLRTSRVNEMNQRGDRQLEGRRVGLAEQKAAQETRKQELKEKAYEEIANLSMDPRNLEPDNLWKLAAPLIKAGDNDAGLGLLKLGIQARGSEKMRNEKHKKFRIVSRI